MDELKRKLVLNKSLEEKSQIFLNESITCIEELSNEIFYEIFDYFNGCKIVKIFSKLNSRFEQLLHSSLILIKTHFYLFNYEKMMNIDDELEIFSNKLCSNLRILSINCSENIIYLDAHRWERLILNSYPQLEKFYLTYDDLIDNNNQYPIYTGQINQFSSSFWIERKWIFHVKINNTLIKYMIYPYKKGWYDCTEDKHIQYSTSTTLFLTFSYDEILFEKIKRVLIITQIYHLIIIEKYSSIHVLIYLIKLLSNLITFKFHSLLSDDRSLPVKEFYALCSIKLRGKIAKVYIEEFNDIEDFDCISALCPRMEYFKVKRVNNINIQLFLRTILRNMKNNNIKYLRSLCFHVPTANDQMIESLQQMIKYEQLLLQFTIERILDNIYLQWK